MKNLLFLLLLIPALALAQSYPNPLIQTTGSTTPRGVADRFAERINVKDFGAKGDALSATGCSISSGGSTLTCTGASFSSGDVGKLVQIDGAGLSGIPLVAAIASVSTSTSVVLSASASYAMPSYSNAAVVLSAKGSGYQIGDTITMAGGTGSIPTVLTVNGLTIGSTLPTLNVGGSGGTAATTCTVYGTTGVGQIWSGIATMSSGILTGLSSLTYGGFYTTAPSSVDPVTTDCGVTGASFNLPVSALAAGGVQVSSIGNYSALPSSPASQASTSGSGSGATFSLTFAETNSAVIYGSDDSAAFSAAITKANSIFSSGNSSCIYIPPGSYFIGTTPIPPFSQNFAGCVVGDSPTASSVFLSESFAGDFFSWSDAWNQGIYNVPCCNIGSALATFAQQGPVIMNLRIAGDRQNTNQQNAMMMYDHNDFFLIQNVNVENLSGRALAIGLVKNDLSAFGREGRISGFRAWLTGLNSTPGAIIPVIEINSTCSSGTTCALDGSNQIDLSDIDVFGAYSSVLVLRDGSTGGSGTRAIRMGRVRIEGLQNNVYGTQAQGDQIKIGDESSVYPGYVGSISCVDCELIAIPAGYFGMRTTAYSSAASPNYVYFSGNAGGGAGSGQPFGILWGANVDIHGAQVYSSGSGTFNLVVGPSTQTAGPIAYSNINNEFSQPFQLGSGASQYVQFGKGQFGEASGSQGNLSFTSTTFGNGTVTYGPVRGQSSTDWQTTRNSTTQGASGQTSTLSGGSLNTASGSYSTVSGGTGNTASGSQSVIAGGANNTNSGFGAAITGGSFVTLSGTYSVGSGRYSADRGRYAANVYASGNFATSGDAQTSVNVLRGTTATTTAVRLTSDNATAGAADCVNLPNQGAYALTVDIVGTVRGTATTSESWNNWTGLIVRGANAAATTLQMSTTPTPFTNGTVTGSSIAATADTTNGCLNITFTPPTSNASTWDVVARVQTVEVQ